MVFFTILAQSGQAEERLNGSGVTAKVVENTVVLGMPEELLLASKSDSDVGSVAALRSDNGIAVEFIAFKKKSITPERPRGGGDFDQPLPEAHERPDLGSMQRTFRCFGICPRR